MAISKTVRFEVFKRDKFTCQYCGKSAPDVVLEADHIHPVSKGGDDDLLNLITSCYDCNHGKQDRLLTDDTSIKKRKKQLDELQEKREQLDLLMRWQRELVHLDEDTLRELADFWSDLVSSYHLNDNGLKSLKEYLRRYSVAEILEAMRISTDQYLQYQSGNGADPNRPTHKSVEKAWEYVGRICASKRRNKDKPYMEDLYYIRGILRKRCRLIQREEWECLDLMERYIFAGLSAENLQAVAKRINSYGEFQKVLALPMKDLCNFMDDKELSEYGQEALQRN